MMMGTKVTWPGELCELTGFQANILKECVDDLLKDLKNFTFQGEKFNIIDVFPLLNKLPSFGKKLLMK